MTTTVMVADPLQAKSDSADDEDANALRRSPDTSKARSDQPGSTGSVMTGHEVVKSTTNGLGQIIAFIFK